MMRKILFTMLALAAVLPTLSQERFVGGDISLLPSYVENGAEYYDPSPIHWLFSSNKA